MEDPNEVLAKKVKHDENESVLRMQETEALKKTLDRYPFISTDAEFLQRPHYSFLDRYDKVLSHDAKESFESDDGDLGADWVNLKPAESRKVATNLEQSAGDLSKSQKEMAEKERKLLKAENLAYSKRWWTNGKTVEEDDIVYEKNLLNARLEVIKAQKDLDINRAKNKTEIRSIEQRAAEAEASAREEFVHMLPIDHPLRKQAVKDKEKATDARRWARWKMKLLSIVGGKEYDHEKEQLEHKQLEAIAQSVKSRHDDNCVEDAILKTKIKEGDVEREVTLINMGKAYMGGSKISYIFMDPTTKKRYLYKKAENCLGLANPKGAVMTSLGAYFQNWLDKDHAIPATAIKNEKGEYIGSIQEIIELQKDGAVDFEKWQQQPEDQRDPSVLTDPVKEQLLTFHVIDWLLCNFDTKGENLLTRSDGKLVSIDKEGALTKIMDDGAQKMSVTYAPHTDEPIYNIFYRMFRDGKIDFTPQNIDVLDKVIQKVEEKSDEEYMKLFEDYYPCIWFNKEERQKRIKERKQNLRASYVTFLNELRPEEKLGDRLKKDSQQG